MRDIINYNFGIEEFLIYPNFLINLFKDYDLINKISFLGKKKFNNLKPFQKEILSYYELIIFKKK